MVCFTTNANPVGSVNFSQNYIYQFHGGILLSNITNGYIVKNKFKRVSSSCVLIIGGHENLVMSNKFLFSGNNSLGNAIDLYYANNAKLIDNYILSGSCYSIFILSSKNIVLENNHVDGGVTYATCITNFINAPKEFNKDILNQFADEKQMEAYNKENPISENISLIENYFTLNRYGLTANSINGLVVKDNVFIQRFNDNNSRKFWTNNDNLLINATNVVWKNNLYKEAFTQDINGNNESSYKFVSFPEHGGVIFN